MQHCARRCAQCEAEKDRASQKQRSDFLAAPVHKAPPDRQKSEREFCLPGGVFLRSACRAMCRAGRFFEACRCLPFARRALVCAGLLLPCLARRAGVQGGAAARRLCVRLPAVMSAFCGFSLPAFRGVASRPACSAAFVWAFTPVACSPVLCCVRGLFFFIFRYFLPHFCLSKIFSFVAQAATGLYFLPKRK